MKPPVGPHEIYNEQRIIIALKWQSAGPRRYFLATVLAIKYLREAELKERHIRNLEAVLTGLEAKVQLARRIPGFETAWRLARPFARVLDRLLGGSRPDGETS